MAAKKTPRKPSPKPAGKSAPLSDAALDKVTGGAGGGVHPSGGGPGG
jgi:hypothetical protein